METDKQLSTGFKAYIIIVTVIYGSSSLLGAFAPDLLAKYYPGLLSEEAMKITALYSATILAFYVLFVTGLVKNSWLFIKPILLNAVAINLLGAIVIFKSAVSSNSGLESVHVVSLVEAFMLTTFNLFFFYTHNKK